MTKKHWRILGFVILVLGTITLLFSVQASHRLLEEIHEKVMGHYTSTYRWHMSAGIIFVIAGLLCVLFPFKNKK
ncbi:MAG: DUF3185 family protein [Chlamydiia bacterium]|nr:DUF3185 family protein [Chlamydiia bacterium]